MSLTRRAAALVVVFAVLVLSYASSLQVFITQQRDQATAEAEIREHRKAIADLEDQLARWEDDDFVRAQARDRLGWVVPGETGYVVIGPDGEPIDGSSQMSADRGLDRESTMTWWQRAWDSVAVADHPTEGGPDALPQPEPTKDR